MGTEMYTDGEYLRNNPTWDAEDAPWKADLILGMLARNRIEPATVCEVGCGCGEILHRLQEKMPPSTRFLGYEISPQAYELCRTRAGANLSFHLGDYCGEQPEPCDLLLLIDLIEHLEDYFAFLRTAKWRSRYTILHIPLEMFAMAVLYPHFLLGQRKKVGHIHHFSKDIAIRMLEDLGYEIVDWEYTMGFCLPRNSGIKDSILKIPRRLVFPVAPDFTVRMFGGFSLLVLVKPRPPETPPAEKNPPGGE